ncbi:MAG TPA: extracellular solute-binding protein [Clostridiales bacterium]|nr:extracellular solute-binding protein [Clostridiales bacterium]
MKREYKVFTCALAALILFTCCSNGPTIAESSQEEFSGYSGEVVFYCSLPEKLMQKLKSGFEKRYSLIDVQYEFASTGKILTRLATEKQTRKVTADLVWVDTFADTIRMKEEGILTPYLSPQAIHFHSDYLDNDYFYAGARMYSFVIAYNTDLVPESEVPRSWQDLLDPKWKGKIVLTDPGDAGSAQHFMALMLLNESYGEEFFTQLRDNGCMLETSMNGTHLQVVQGNYPIGIGLDYMVESMAASGEPIAAIRPEKDGVTLFSPIGLVEGGPNLRNARLLYDYILSEEGQNILKSSHLRGIRDDGQEGSNRKTVLKNDMWVDDWLMYDKAAEMLATFDRIFFEGRTTPR